GRDDVYLYMVKSVAKRGLHSITDAELAATNGHDVTDVVQGRYEYRVYANLTDAGVDLVQAQGAQLAAIAGVTGYKFAKPVARWRRDTMVVYCTTSAAADAVIAVLRGLQAGVPGPAVHFAADVPHFTRPAPNCRGVSSVRDPQAGAGGSFSERMADMIRLAIDAGVDSVDEAHPSIASYVVGIVDKLEGLWNDPGAMRGEPKP
ncbi:hypothetical protein, partial [Pseudonocardia sp.]|uniref:hypothetical protein n=1 Tax=Pseudonocardia sp. TaxID=60912 RepID=UPI003D0AED50